MANFAPLIVSALLGGADFAWLDLLRRAHFPPERNVLAAHLAIPSLAAVTGSGGPPPSQ